MRHWVGKPVIMYCGVRPYTIMKGVLRKWDSSTRIAVIGHQEIAVPFRDIVFIKALAPRERALPPVLHSIGYIMRERQQFDNAVYFKSAVSVWKDDQLLAFNTTIVSHTKGTVTLQDGQNLLKGTHLFVVRSLRG
ncbi:hypothetical protein H1230_10055 [Paenibacillus sp. 19GGS1-52]|uniref:hypothetical protein n=1 Tax=Paenibacillus sp. 19GGS1-52 TaxID=2758563 RepID=UPI001EFAD619|nr:hypothetical protein [Paenibacillus sp. 19GGS1-52]ULO09073.1 hypothetical protein H1230_10055 [Paenibacillus sp. 19GGS1-52]